MLNDTHIICYNTNERIFVSTVDEITHETMYKLNTITNQTIRCYYNTCLHDSQSKSLLPLNYLSENQIYIGNIIIHKLQIPKSNIIDYQLPDNCL